MANYNPPTNAFQKGIAPGRPKGAVARTNVVKRALNKLDMDATINDELIPTLVDDIRELSGRDRVVAILGILEYYKPKLARKELIELKEKQVINIVGKVKNKPQIRKEPDGFDMFPTDDSSEDIPFAEEV